jgi:1-acylglycerone phosphate reductase
MDESERQSDSSAGMLVPSSGVIVVRAPSSAIRRVVAAAVMATCFCVLFQVTESRPTEGTEAANLISSNMTITRKSVLITGCSAGGIGEGLAEAFHEKGYHVFASARTVSKISGSLAKASNVDVLALDVSSPESITSAAQSIGKATGGKLDVLINNAGRVMLMPGLDVSIDEAKSLFDTNFWALLITIQAFAPLLIKARGYVVNNTSLSGVVPFGCFMSIYNSSKAAAILGSETWRLELAPLGVRTITLMTAAVKTHAIDNVNPVELQQNSYYYGIRDWIDQWRTSDVQKDGITALEFGRKVARHVEKGSTGKVWLGGGAQGGRLASWLLPDKMMVRHKWPLKTNRIG